MTAYVSPICAYPDRSYATFTIDFDSTNWRTLVLATSQEGVYSIQENEPSFSYDCAAMDLTNHCALYTDDWHVAEHTKAFIMSAEDYSYIESGEYVIDKISGEMFSIREVEQAGRLSEIATSDWDGMGVQYLGRDVFNNLYTRVDVEMAGVAVVVLLRVGD